MATTTLIPVEEYLAARFDGPTPEYLDGQLVERGVPTFAHGSAQLRVGAFFARLSPPLFPATEVDFQATPTRVRVLDVGVYYGARPSSREDIPLIAVEIVSPTDILGKVVDRFEELRAAGVPHLWLIDPVHHALYRFGKHGIVEVDALEVPDLGKALTLGDVFD